MVKIVSGGQTGVDRAALDAALARGFELGGWCPKDRRATDGRVPDIYPLDEAPSLAYRQRTEWNVRDTDGTLILHRGDLSGGTRLTADFAHQYCRPLFLVDLQASEPGVSILQWLGDNEIKTLNVAGPREENEPGIYRDALDFILNMLDQLQKKVA